MRISSAVLVKSLNKHDQLSENRACYYDNDFAQKRSRCDLTDCETAASTNTSTIHFPPYPNLQYFQPANLVIPQMHSSRRDEGTKQKDEADRHSCCTPYVYKRAHLTKCTLTLAMPETGYLVCNTFFCV